MDAARDIVAWKIAFYGQPKGFERFVLRPGFRHCSAFGWVTDGLWLEIDANLAAIDTRILNHAAYVARLVELELQGAVFVTAETRAMKGYRWSPTCAGVIAGLLGVGAVVRPQTLHDKLIAERGAMA